MDSRKRKGSNIRPTLDDFHQIVKQLAHDQKFTKAAVESFRHVFFSYLHEIALSLVEHDKVSESDGNVSKACVLDDSPLFVTWEKEARDLLQAKRNSSTSTDRRSKPKRPKQVTEEMEAEQERLLKKSMDTLKEQQESK
jgi:hypothetical protein